ncbi:MAG: putative hydro-lyase [Planctomycetes bacterium]|nr:putative hydro-lyase [Planctomycetota bacterium]
MDDRPFERALPSEVRAACRTGVMTGPTAGVAAGYAQANLVVLRESDAADFRSFCEQNPKPCPLFEVTRAGSYEPVELAPDADLRTDLPRYRVYEKGVHTASPTSIESYWHGDFVAFLIGCSFTFEWALLEAGLPVRHIEEGVNVPMYRTNIACIPAGAFAANMVVSMRPMTPAQAKRAAEITAAFPSVHGEPIHIGEPSAIGITDITRPDYGDAVTIRPDEVPVFWACGVTPMEALLQAKPEIAITHEPGHMFVTDVTDESLRVSSG